MADGGAPVMESHDDTCCGMGEESGRIAAAKSGTVHHPMKTIDIAPATGESMNSDSGQDGSPLGQFGLSDYTIQIYANGHDSAGEMAYTHLHETTHHKLLLSTEFGALQTLLGVAFPAAPRGPAGWARQAGALLEEAMDASWTADEGYAVYSELVLSRLLGYGEQPAPLPDEYAAAFEVYRDIAARLPEAVQPLEVFVVDGVAQAAFNSGILAAWKPESGTAAELQVLLRNPLYRPDERLAWFAAFLSLDDEDAGRLLARCFKAAGENGRTAGMTLDEMARAAWHPANRALRTALLDAAGEIVADAAARCLPHLTILPPQQALAQVLEFFGSARTLLGAHGVEFPELVLAEDADPMELGQAHVVGQRFARITAEPREFGAVTKACLRPGSIFVLQVGGHPFDPPEQRAFFAHAFGTGSGAGKEDSTCSVQTVGQWAEIADAVRQTVAHGGAILLVDASVMDPFRAGIWASVAALAEEIGQDVLVVAPSTFGTDVRDLLLGLRTVGVDTLFEVAILKGTSAFIAGTRTGLAVLFPVPFIVANRLRAHHPDLFAWFSSVLGTGAPVETGEAEPALEVLRAVASLLLQGALTLSRPSWTRLKPG